MGTRRGRRQLVGRCRTVPPTPPLSDNGPSFTIRFNPLRSSPPAHFPWLDASDRYGLERHRDDFPERPVSIAGQAVARGCHLHLREHLFLRRSLKEAGITLATCLGRQTFRTSQRRKRTSETTTRMTCSWCSTERRTRTKNVTPTSHGRCGCSALDRSEKLVREALRNAFED